MRIFIIKLLLFSIPLLAVFLLPLTIYLVSGEYIPLSRVVMSQQTSPEDSLYLSGITSANDRLYKSLTTTFINPEIIALGTSRTLTIKADFFKNPATFYNAGYNGGLTLRSHDLIDFIESISQDSKLKVILFDASSYLSESAASPTESTDSFETFRAFMTEYWRTQYDDLIHRRFSLTKLLGSYNTNSNVGTIARLYGNGYRKDGSLNRSSQGTPHELTARVQDEIKNELTTISSLPDHGGLIDYSSTIPNNDLENIATFLARCSKRHIYVVGYLSTYAPEIHQALLSLQDGYGESYRNATIRLIPLFKKEDYPFFDMRDMTAYGASSAELYDSHHPTEKSTLRLLRVLLDNTKELRPYMDYTELTKKINSEQY